MVTVGTTHRWSDCSVATRASGCQTQAMRQSKKPCVINHIGIANCYQLYVDLDKWIRRRVRMGYWRQWRKPRTKVRSLIKLGVHVQAAVACGTTSKGPWRSSKTPGLQQALSNACCNPKDFMRCAMGGLSLSILSETPCADPHAGCCGG